MTSMSYAKIVDAYKENGLDAVLKMDEDGDVSTYSLRRAAEALLAERIACGDLTQWLRESRRVFRAGQLPEPGESRVYNAVQQSNRGGFIRIPTDVFEVEIGRDALEVTFDYDPERPLDGTFHGRVVRGGYVPKRKNS